MDFGHEESSSSLGDYINISRSSKLTSTSNLSSIARVSIEKSVFSEIDENVSRETDMDAIIHLWVNMFKQKPGNATLKLFTLALNCFEIDANDMGIIKFDAVFMYREMIKCFNSKEKSGLLPSPLVVKKSSDVLKMLTFFSLIFRHHSNLFFSNDSNKRYFIFLRDIFMKLSKCNFVGPRLLGTSFGLKIVTGLVQSNNLDINRNDLNMLLKEFFIKRWNDTNCIIRETVLLELKLWIQIDSSFLRDYWLYVYRSFGDQSASVQTIALKMTENILNIHKDVPNLKLLIKPIINVLPNLLLSKNEEVIISAFDLYSILRRIEEDYEYMENIEPIALELIFSEKSNIAQLAAKHFVNEIVISNPVLSEQIKVLLKLLQGIPPCMKSVAASFYVDAIYDLCHPLLTDFKLISQMLAVENYIEDTDKYNLMTLLMYVIKWLITGIKPEHKTTNMGDTNDVMELHFNILKKKEFTTYISMHLLKQLRECKEPNHAFSLWVLLQYCDYKLLQDKMIIPEILKCVILFYNTWNIPTILEMISKCINIITSNIEGREQSLCLKCIEDIAQPNINTLIAGIENSLENAPSVLNQKNALIKIWTLAKYNYIPDELEPLKHLSYYIPNLNDMKDNLIVSEYALNAYMEVLKKILVKSPIDSHNKSSDYPPSFVETRDKFLDAMFIILSKCNHQIFSICETAFLIINKMLRLKSNTIETDYVLQSKQNIMLTDFIYYVSQNCDDDDDSNTLKLIEIYVRLIQDGILNMNHLIVLLQFIKMEIFERALQPIFNFFCKKETGGDLSNVINVILVYMFENIISRKSDFQNSSIKDIIDVATIITRLLSKCVDQVGKRLVSTNIHRHGIQYAMSDDTYDYPFIQFFSVLVPLCDSLIPYDAQRLCNYFLQKPAVAELINAENVHILNYLYKLQEICNAEKN